jgi:hypothetical protein
MDRFLIFDDLREDSPGIMPLMLGEGFQEEVEERQRAFVVDDPKPFEPLHVLSFKAFNGCFGRVLIRRSDLHGTVEDNVDAIRATAPRHCDVEVRFGII